MISIDNLSFSYSENTVLENVNARFEEGMIHGILGKNGAGKSTLFRLILNWIKPDTGKIELEGSPYEIGFLPSENYFYPGMKAIEYLQLFQHDPSLNLDNWAEVLHLPLDGFPEEFSSGMKKKLAFLGVKLQGRKWIILDEPLNGVDLESHEIILRIIKEWKKDATLLISSHNLHSLMKVSDQIFLLENKKFQQVYQKEEYGDLEKYLEEGIEEKMRKIFPG